VPTGVYGLFFLACFFSCADWERWGMIADDDDGIPCQTGWRPQRKDSNFRLTCQGQGSIVTTVKEYAWLFDGNRGR